MWRQVRVNAYDMLDTVQVSITCDEWEGPTRGAPTEVRHYSFGIRSKGHSDADAWVGDVAQAVLDFINHVQDIDREE